MVSRIVWSLVVSWCVLTQVVAQAASVLRLATDPWIAWAPVWVAKEKGLWTRHGVAVDVVGFTGSDAQEALIAGKVDCAMMMAGTAVGMRLTRGLDLVVLAEVDWSHGGDKIVVRAGTRVKDLAGKRIGIYEDSPAVLMFVGRKLAAEGVDMARVEIVVIQEPEALASQFRAGRLDCVASYEPYVAEMVRHGGELVATTADFPGVMPEVLVARRDRLAALPPAHVVGLLRGWIDAVTWAQAPEHRDEFVRLCAAKALFDAPVQVHEVPALLQNVRIHAPAQLRERNFGEVGIASFLDECLAFAARRAGAQQWPRAASMLETKYLKAALEEPRAAPAK